MTDTSPEMPASHQGRLRRRFRGGRLFTVGLLLIAAVVAATGTVDAPLGSPVGTAGTAMNGTVMNGTVVSVPGPDRPWPRRAPLAVLTPPFTVLPPPLPVVPPPAASPVPRSAPGDPRLTVPILLYHYIRVSPPAHGALGFQLSVTPQAFAAQMDLLRAGGRTPITVSRLIDALAGRPRLPAHPVVLTFDDGYADFATAALPVLVRHGFAATAYVVSGFVGRHGYMSAEQVRAAAAAGIEIGSHTVHHLNLASVPMPLAVAEMAAGRAALEQLLGKPVPDFAYPYGGVTAALASQALQAGFRSAVTTMSGETHVFGARFTLHRDRVLGSAALPDFARLVGLPYARLTAASAAPPSPDQGWWRPSITHPG